MGFLIFSGIVAFVFGIMFIFFPRTLVRWNELCNRMVISIEDKTKVYRIVVGIFLILVSILCLLTAYHINA